MIDNENNNLNSLNNLNNNEAEKVIRIVQITDPHLVSDLDALMLGINTEESFSDVINLVRQEESNIDCVLCTGDISQDASVAAYQRFNDAISSFSAPHLWLSGNHDNNDQIKEALGEDSPCLNKSLILGNWQIITLDSSVDQKTYGHLSESELDFLNKALKESAEKGLHALVCVHHNPVPVNAAWLQNICLHNSADFFQVTDQFQHVKGVLFGHVHQELQTIRNNVLMMASPSTCIQFHPDNDNFSLEDINPGYRWLDLSSKGEISTGVKRVKDKRYNFDFLSTGY